MSIFGYDGKVMRFLNSFWELVWLNVLWLVCSIPLFTLGAASTAAYYTMVKCIRNGRGHVTIEFFRSFRNNFKTATFFTLIYLAIGGFLAADAYFFYYSDAKYAQAGLWISYLLIAFLLIIMNYTFPWLARFEIKKKALWKTSISLALLHIPFSLGLISLTFLAGMGIYMCYIAVLLLPGIKLFLDSLIIEYLIKKYLPKEETGNESTK